jgi:hypothetical protein
MKSVKGIFIFVLGVVTGTFAGAQIAKKKYEEIANEEIEEIRAYYKERELEKQVEPQEPIKIEEPEAEEIEITEDEIKVYNNIIRGNYMAYEEEEQTNTQYAPYPIDPSDFGKDGEYDTMTCTYFADGVLVDDVDQEFEDWDLHVGKHHIDIFNEFSEATCIYVRNDLDGMDYEILKDDWCWSDFNEKGYAPPLEEKPDKKPHQL